MIEAHKEFVRAPMTDALPAATIGSVQACLRFARGGGRTFLAQQAVRYPFHITRPHYLDAARPDLATLYLQSASGGLYRGDRLALSVQVGVGALAHVTSQAATVVHATAASGIRVDTRVSVDRDAFLALTTDPYILFPATELSVATEITLASSASAILAEAFSAHDPAARDTPFAQLSAACRIVDPDGRVLVDERSHIDGLAYHGAASPLELHRAMGAVSLLGKAALGLDPAQVEAALDEVGVLAGASRLPNEVGLGVRLLAKDGGRLARGLERAFAIGYEAMLGFAPERRRK